MDERKPGFGGGRYQDIRLEDLQHSFLGMIDVAEREGYSLSFNSVIQLTRQHLTVQDFISGEAATIERFREPVYKTLTALLGIYGPEQFIRMSAERTFYHLIFMGMGVNESLPRLLKVKGFDYHSFKRVDYETFKEKTGGRNRLNTYEKLMTSYLAFEEAMGSCSSESVLPESYQTPVNPPVGRHAPIGKRQFTLLERKFLQKWYDELDDTFTVEELREKFGRDERYVRLVLQASEQKGLLAHDEHVVKKIRRTFEEFLVWDGLPEKEFMRMRFQGLKSVNEISEQRGISRQRISTRLNTAVGLVPLTHIDETNAHLKLFTQFSISEDAFVEIFDMHRGVYRLLSAKLKRGERHISEIYDNLEPEQQSRFERHFSLFLYDGELVPVNKKNIFEHVLRIHASTTPLHIGEVKRHYEQFIAEHIPSELATSLLTDEMTLKGVGERSEFVINSYGHGLRFHDPKVFTGERVERLLRLLQLEPGVYNTRYIFQLDPELMEELNCQDPSELHNIIKTRISHPHVTMGRMPELAIGVSDKLTWVRHLIREHAPIPLEEFLDMLSRRFGLHIPSMRSLVQTTMLEHLSPDNVLIASFPVITDEETEWLRGILVEAIYTFDQLLDLYKDVPDLYDRFLNKWVLSHVGYTISGGFIVQSEYGSGEAYFRCVIKSKDLYRIQDIPAAKTQSYFKVLKDLETELEIFRADDDHYMNIGRLEKGGFSKSMIRAEIEGIVETARHLDTEYFTFPMLQEVLDSELVDLGMENVFYERLIRLHPDVNFIPSGGGDIFYFSREKRMLGHFYLAHLHESEGTDVHVFERGLEERYGMMFNSGKIIDSIRDRGGFFSPETEKVYRDKSIFLDDLYRD